MLTASRIYLSPPPSKVDPVPPAEAQTEAEKVAYCAGWWAALEQNRKHNKDPLLQQALEALKMMRDRYGEYACPACDHADAAIFALWKDLK